MSICSELLLSVAAILAVAYFASILPPRLAHLSPPEAPWIVERVTGTTGEAVDKRYQVILTLKTVVRLLIWNLSCKLFILRVALRVGKCPKDLNHVRYECLSLSLQESVFRVTAAVSGFCGVYEKVLTHEKRSGVVDTLAVKMATDRGNTSRMATQKRQNREDLGDP